jgi:hypothetical protein
VPVPVPLSENRTCRSHKVKADDEGALHGY